MAQQSIADAEPTPRRVWVAHMTRPGRTTELIGEAHVFTLYQALAVFFDDPRLHEAESFSVRLDPGRTVAE